MRIRSWRLLGACAVLLTAGCSSEYESENLAALAPLNSLSGVVELGAASSSTYCLLHDTCWFGDDRTSTTVDVTFGVDVDEAVPIMASALGAESYREEDCSGPDADCAGGREIYFEVGGTTGSIQLLVQGDRDGTLQLDVRNQDFSDA